MNISNMETETLADILVNISKLQKPGSLSEVEAALKEQRRTLREELYEELRRSLNYKNIKTHPELTKHGFQFTESVKDAIARVIADVLVQDGCNWDKHPVIKIEPAVFLNPGKSLEDSAVVILHFSDGQKEHRSTSFRYK